MSQKKIVIQELDRDRYSRVATFNLGEIKIKFPNFFPRVKNQAELNSLISLITLYPQEHIGAFNVRLSDQPNEIFRNKSELNQMSMSMDSYAFEHIKKFYSNTALLVDPSSEYMFYEGNKDGAKLLRQLQHINKRQKKLLTVVDFLKNKEFNKKNMFNNEFNRWKKAAYKKFWYDLDRNQKEMYKLIGETHDIEVGYDSNILLPFVPIILNEGLLDICIRINKISNAIAPTHSATYFIINISALKNDKIMDGIIDFLYKDPNKITVFKIKYVGLHKAGFMVQRENYRGLMKSMSSIIEDNEEKSFFLMDSDVQSFPSATVGFDMVSTSMTGLDGDGIFGSSPYGGWFYPKKLWSIPYKQATTIFENNRGNPPCSCPACTDIASIGPRKIGHIQWNDLRREHYLFSMNNLMKTIVNSISQRKIEFIRQHILESEVPKLAEIIPRM